MSIYNVFNFVYFVVSIGFLRNHQDGVIPALGLKMAPQYVGGIEFCVSRGSDLRWIGHIGQHLSNNFFVLNLPAFCIHQILELCARGHQYCRSKFSSRKEYWNNLCIVIRVMLFTVEKIKADVYVPSARDL